MQGFAKGLTSGGSSPRLRGTPVRCHSVQLQQGIIPALAGNTRASCTALPWNWDHPRACGEHTGFTFKQNNIVGSSPRLRGTHICADGACEGHGIIPALAGNTSNARWNASRPWDHPRACGEHLEVKPLHDGWQGSSPRLRGTRYEIPIIPTYQNEEKTVFLHFFSSWSQ